MQTQKRTVKDKYVDILIELAKKIGLDLGPMTITDDELSARVIDGYLKGSGYYFTHPVDRECFLTTMYISILLGVGIGHYFARYLPDYCAKYSVVQCL